MKSANNIARTIASTLLLVAAFATASLAVTKPLSYPKGLAVDAKGNLSFEPAFDSNGTYRANGRAAREKIDGFLVNYCAAQFSALQDFR